MASTKLGNECGWAPAPGSIVRTTWARAAGQTDPLAITLTESDVAATLLVRSALEHASDVGDAISSGRAFLPYSVGRTAVEHSLRAVHLLDDQATDIERATRRLNDWLYAIEEAEQLQKGIANHQHPGWEDMPDYGDQRSRALRRARDLGLAVSDGKSPRVGSESRMSTLALGEKYLSGQGGGGVPSVLLRRHAAADHGIETGLMESVEDWFGPEGVNIMRPATPSLSRMGFSLMGVPLAVLSAFRTLHHHYAWPEGRGQAERVAKEHDRLVTLWRELVTEYLDVVAPEREKDGIFSERPFGQPRGTDTPLED